MASPWDRVLTPRTAHDIAKGVHPGICVQVRANPLFNQTSRIRICQFMRLILLSVSLPARARVPSPWFDWDAQEKRADWPTRYLRRSAPCWHWLPGEMHLPQAWHRQHDERWQERRQQWSTERTWQYSTQDITSCTPFWSSRFVTVHGGFI